MLRGERNHLELLGTKESKFIGASPQAFNIFGELRQFLDVLGLGSALLGQDRSRIQLAFLSDL